MLNQIVLVGRLVKDIEVKENCESASIMTLALPRSYKNMDGVYETDFIEVILWGNMSKSAAEYCRKGDLLGIKGRIQTREVEKEDGTKFYKLEIIADKVTLLSSRQVDEDSEE